MKKMFHYSGIDITIEPAAYYGHYWIRATVRGVSVEKLITDSSIYDWCDDDTSYDAHLQALDEAYGYTISEANNKI